MKTSLSKLQQIFHSPKIAAILNFQIFFKTQKHLYLKNRGGHFEFCAKITKLKNACILKTVRDRAILAKFFNHRVSLNTSLSKFQRTFHSPKMAAILNFQFFFKNAKHKNACILKTVLDRAILTNLLIHRETAE